MNASSLFKTIDSANDSLSRGGLLKLGKFLAILFVVSVALFSNDAVPKAGLAWHDIFQSYNSDLHPIKESEIQIGPKML